MAAPIAIGMVFQSLYFLVDLYFVGTLGDAAIAGVSAAGNVTFIVIALTQVLAVGTVALVAQALGRRDRADAQLVFNQSLSLAGVFTAGPPTCECSVPMPPPRPRAPSTCVGTCRAWRCSSRWCRWGPRCAAPAS
jgi:O-antigen/teichoic acid export membrane protein